MATIDQIRNIANTEAAAASAKLAELDGIVGSLPPEFINDPRRLLRAARESLAAYADQIGELASRLKV
jgi:hypothetical protein